jgi:hypothetical protein
MAAEMGVCGYCGRFTMTDTEHVVHRGLFPKGYRGGVEFVRVRSCKDCNNSVSADEDDFRNFCVLAGEKNEAKHELFYGPMSRYWNRPEGKGSLARAFSKMQMAAPVDHTRTRIFADQGVFRVARKIVRGLYYHHFRDVLPERYVELTVLYDGFPDEIKRAPEWRALNPQVFRYGFVVNDDEPGVHSGWAIEIYEAVAFVANVRNNAYFVP